MIKKDMGTGKISSLMASMIIPPMISMFIQSLYNIVDSIFIAKFSQDALTAVSLVFPIQNIILSLAVGAGIGLNSYIARKLGSEDRYSAEEACSVGMVLGVLHYIVLSIAGLIILKPFLGLFTNSQEITYQGVIYGRIILIFSFGQILHILLEKIYQAYGNMVVPMIAQAIGCIINIILDPILIFGVFGLKPMGIAGAAIATIIGQISSFLICAVILINGRTGIKFRKYRDKSHFMEVGKQIYQVAVPSTIVMAFPSVLIACINGIIAPFSAFAVSAFGIYYKVQTFIYMPTGGLVQGIRPIIGFNYGAGNVKRQKDTVKLSLIIVGLIMALGTIACLGFSDKILSIFDSSGEMAAIGVPLLMIISLGFIPSSFSVVLSGFFEGRGNGFNSLIVTSLRMLVILLPLTFIFSKIWGLTGVWTAFPIAEAITALVAMILYKRTFK